MIRGGVLVFVSAVLLGLFIVAVVPVLASSGDCWISKAPMQQARSHLSATTVNGKIYAIGGIAEGGIFVGTNEEYNPETDTWTYKSAMPTPRDNFAIAVCQNKIYCIGGYRGVTDVTGVNEVYDPATDTWETKAPMPNATATQASVVNGKIYLIGGSYNLTQVYDTQTDTWTTKTPMPIQVAGSSTVFEDKIYLIGGFHAGLFNDTSVTQIYDPSTDEWSLGAPSPTYFMDGLAVATSGMLAPKRIYVFDIPYNDNVTDPDDPLYRTQVYDPKTDSWVAGAGAPEGRDGFGIAALSDTFYVIGGYVQVGTGGLMEGFRPIFEGSAANEQYLPIGYGTPDPSYQTPTPTPTSTSTPTPTPAPTPTPTPSQTSTPTQSPSMSPTETPTAPPSQQPETTPPTDIYLIAAAAAVIIAIVAAVAVVMFRKRK